MPRPIVWACGLLVSACVTGLGFGDRLRAVGLVPAGPSAPAAGGDAVVVLNADLRGHFTVHPSVEGRALRMLVDTGASTVALSHEDALSAGIRLKAGDYNRPVGTANGTVMAASVRIAEMRLGGIRVTGVEAMVLPQGRLGTSLLGMSFLKRLKGFEVAQGRLTLRG